MLLKLMDVVKKRYQGDNGFELIIPQLEIGYGKFIAIVGSSGCGKSTFLDMLALVSKPDKSKNFTYHFSDKENQTEYNINQLWKNINNDNILAAIRRKKIGYILQTGGLLPFLSAKQNILLQAKFNNIERDAMLEEFAESLGILNILNKKPKNLSGGQRQRVAILRAIIHSPNIILADEPTAAVDKERAKIIVDEMKKLAENLNTTIVMVTHDFDLIKDRVDTIFQFNLTESKSKNVVYSEMVEV